MNWVDWFIGFKLSLELRSRFFVTILYVLQFLLSDPSDFFFTLFPFISNSKLSTLEDVEMSDWEIIVDIKYILFKAREIKIKLS